MHDRLNFGVSYSATLVVYNIASSPPDNNELLKKDFSFSLDTRRHRQQVNDLITYISQAISDAELSIENSNIILDFNCYGGCDASFFDVLIT